VTSATVTYDLGAVFGIDRFALWNEDAAGIAAFNLLGVDERAPRSPPMLAGVSPIDNPVANYPAQVFSFAAVDARFVRLEALRCPQPDGTSYNGCSIGEVAFRTSAVIPEPSTYALVGAGLAGLLGVRAAARARADVRPAERGPRGGVHRVGAPSRRFGPRRAATPGVQRFRCHRRARGLARGP
jgi:hypothetical protein